MSNRELQIGIFGTFDIESYGDLLFPLIAEFELRQRLGAVKLHRFSFGRKTPPDWPYTVTSLADLPAVVESLDGVLIGGGHIIRFDKMVAEGYGPPTPEIHYPTGYWLAPILIALQYGIPVAWNAPGVHGEIPAWAAPLVELAVAHSNYVAVRDEESRQTLARCASQAEIALTPDTAFAIARLLEPHQPSADFVHLRHSLGLTRPYLIVQATTGLENFTRLVRDHPQLFRDYQLVALPIAPVLGDSVAVLERQVPEIVCLPQWPNPLLLAELIAGASAVVGISLHLAITALACGVPVFRPADQLEEKHTTLSQFDTVFHFDNAQAISPECFTERLGRAAPSAAVRAVLGQLTGHWDQIAASFTNRVSRRAAHPALARFWQSLPVLLEMQAPENWPQEACARDKHIAALRHSVEEKNKIIAELNFHLLAIQGTIGWKVLERLRGVRDRLLPPNSRRRNLYAAFHRAVEVVLDEGLRVVLRKMVHRIRMALGGQGILLKAPPQDVTQNLSGQYQLWLQRHELTPKDVARMRAAVEIFPYTPLISIVTRVYDADETYLRNAIESVRAQIYPHWELCLVNDASTKPHVRPILDEYAAVDRRIKVEHVLKSEGIAGASNQGLNLAAGEFVGFLDHADELSPDAMFEVVKRLNEDPGADLLYSDEDKLELDGQRVEPFFKPDWSPDLLLSVNYMSHFSAFRRSLLGEIGGFRHGFDGSEDYDLLLRVTERTDKIAHLPKILYHQRKTPGSAAASSAFEPRAHEGGQQALEDALVRRGYEGRVESILPGFYTARYRLRGTPLVSVIIPTRDRWQLLQQCLSSLEEKTGYSRYEIIVLDNDSSEPETLKYLDTIAGKWRVYRYPGPFNFAAINNFGAAQARGDYLVFLNNDIQVIRSDWLTAMLEQAQRPGVGGVGAKLLYPDGRIQHAGVVVGIGGGAGHAFKGLRLPDHALGYFSLADVVRDCGAVTAACMMVPRRVFEELRGFDERFRVAFNDVDFCLRLRQRGHLIVYTPLALLYHHEGASRGRVHPPEEERLLQKLWGGIIRAGDPYYNPNLTLSREDWSLRF